MKILKPSPEIKARHLQSLEIFSDLDKTEILMLSEKASMRFWDKSEFLFRRDEAAEKLEILVEGTATVYSILNDGSQKVIHIVSPVTTVGEAACFLGRPFPANCQMTTDGATLCIPRNSLLEFSQQYPDISWKLIGGLYSRLREFKNTVENHSNKSAVSRLATYIIGEARHGKEFILPAKKNQVANFLGLRPESFSRAISQLSSDGAVEFDGNIVTVIDIHRLESFLFPE
ncbi:MAG: Crp/Fnr family transcriptional regulator [Deltaproteobacteria bacterium]|nr:Crp/Fnr family transcriptional regulator [Deltaproteobacteria bacterium]